jgi:hypothetical protein
MFSIDGFSNESDVEQKFVYPFLTSSDGLGFRDSEVATKTRIRKLTIDKGHSMKPGYFPDYIVSIDAVPIAVLEAKAPGVPLSEAIREGRLYAAELNAQYPRGVNPVQLVIATNGEQIIFAAVDSIAEFEQFNVSDLTVHRAELQAVRAKYSRDALLNEALVLKKKIWIPRRYRPLNFMSSAAQNEEVDPNRFARQLIPHIKKYFDPDASRTRLEIVERAYVSTEQVTQYNEILETLLTDNLGNKKFKEFDELVTTKNDAKGFNSALKAALVKGARTESLLLLIGGVGSGKSIFIDRFFYLLMDEEIRNSTLWAYVDFNDAPSDLTGLQRWICERVLQDLEERNQIESFHSNENLLRYFSPEIRKFRAGVGASLFEFDRPEYERRLATKLEEWTSDPLVYVKNVLRHLVGDTGKRVVIVFDNADKRDRDQQLAIFQEVQNFRSVHRVFSILALRDETYDRHKLEPPLDTYLAAFTFRISPPRFLDVVKRRLELIIEDLADEVDKRLEFRLPTGAVVRYPSTDLGNFLISFYQSLFHPKREIRLVLEALIGRNVRNALQMFSDILISGHLTEDKVFLARASGGAVHLPERLVIRILMRTKYRYYSDEHGYISNIFSKVQESTTHSPFSMILVLGNLSDARKVRGELGIEGYRRVAEFALELVPQGVGEPEIIAILNHLLSRGLVQADHQRRDFVTKDDFVKITASGYFHLKFLTNRFEYCAGVAGDVYYKTERRAQEVYDLARHNSGHPARKGRDRIKRARLLVKELLEEKENWGAASVSQVGKHVEESIAALENAIGHFEQGAPAQGKIDFAWRKK